MLFQTRYYYYNNIQYDTRCYYYYYYYYRDRAWRSGSSTRPAVPGCVCVAGRPVNGCAAATDGERVARRRPSTAVRRSCDVTFYIHTGVERKFLVTLLRALL